LHSIHGTDVSGTLVTDLGETSHTGGRRYGQCCQYQCKWLPVKSRLSRLRIYEMTHYNMCWARRNSILSHSLMVHIRYEYNDLTCTRLKTDKIYVDCWIMNSLMNKPSSVARNLSWVGCTSETQRTEIRGRRPTVGKLILGRRQQSPSQHLSGMGECCTFTQQSSGWIRDRKFIYDALRAQKTRLLATNVVSLR